MTVFLTSLLIVLTFIDASFSCLMPTDISAFTFHQDGLGCGLQSELYCFAGIEPAPESPEGRMPQEFYLFSFLLSPRSEAGWRTIRLTRRGLLPQAVSSRSLKSYLQTAHIRRFICNLIRVKKCRRQVVSHCSMDIPRISEVPVDLMISISLRNPLGMKLALLKRIALAYKFLLHPYLLSNNIC